MLDVMALAEACRDNDRIAILQALYAIARVHGISRLAKESALDRAVLQRTFSATGNPLFSRLISMIDGLGLSLSVQILHNTGMPVDCLQHRRKAVQASIAGEYTAMLGSLGLAAIAYGVTDFAKVTTLERWVVYRSLSSSGNPKLSILCKALDGLGMCLKVRRR